MFICLLEVATRNQRSAKRRGNFTSGSGNFSYNEGQARKPTPQKFKNTWDKRPRQRGEFSTRSGGDVSIVIVLLFLMTDHVIKLFYAFIEEVIECIMYMYFDTSLKTW